MKFFGYKTLLISLFSLSTLLVFSTDVPPCYRNLEVNFFRTDLVNEALSLHGVSQSKWNLINTQLQGNVKGVPQLVKEKAKKMEPNPFDPPFQSQEAAELLRQVLLEVFSETLANFHITNQANVKEMFQYIRERQSQLLISCFGQEKEEKHN